MKRMLWVDIGRWKADFENEKENESCKAVSARVYKEIPGWEYGDKETHHMVFKTRDEEEAKTVKAKVIAILKEAQTSTAWEGIDIRTQPVCQDCGMLGEFNTTGCAECGGDLV